MGKRKTYDELTFTDDFMFREVMENHPEICQELAELLTGRKVLEVRLPEAQKEEKFLYKGRGVRFDIYFEDQANTVYDIEMQTVVRTSIKKRSRYYSSMLDMDHLRQHMSYSELPDTYIVFICLDDPFHRDSVRYTFRETCEELPDLKLEDGSTIIFINSKGKDGASPELQDFLEYLNGRLPKSDLTEAIDRAVRDQKEDERGRRKYMTLQEHYDIEHEDGVQEGIVRGRKEGWKEGIAAGQKQMSLVLKNLFDAGKTDEVEKALNDEDYLNKLITEFKDK